MWGHMLVLVPAAVVFDPGPWLPASAQGWAALIGVATLAALLPQLAFTLRAPRAGAVLLLAAVFVARRVR